MIGTAVTSTVFHKSPRPCICWSLLKLSRFPGCWTLFLSVFASLEYTSTDIVLYTLVFTGIITFLSLPRSRDTRSVYGRNRSYRARIRPYFTVLPGTVIRAYIAVTVYDKIRKPYMESIRSYCDYINRHNFFIGDKRESCEIDFLDWFCLFSILVILYTAKTKTKQSKSINSEPIAT